MVEQLLTSLTRLPAVGRSHPAVRRFAELLRDKSLVAMPLPAWPGSGKRRSNSGKATPPPPPMCPLEPGLPPPEPARGAHIGTG